MISRFLDIISSTIMYQPDIIGDNYLAAFC